MMMICVEEGSLSKTLAFDSGHGYAQEDYAMREARGCLCDDVVLCQTI